MKHFSLKSNFVIQLKIICSLTVTILLSACGGGSSEELQAITPPTNIVAVLTITSEDGGVYNDGQIITLTATAIDDEDGDISSSIQWSSNVDGVLGVGANLNVQLSTGSHIITASVTDSDNLSVNSNITASMNAPAYGEAQLSWNTPTENTDNTALTDLSGFKIYYGQSANNLSLSITITDPNTTTFLIQNLTTETTFYFAVTAVNALGLESELSNLSSKFIPG